MNKQRTALLALGWLLACAALCGVAMTLDLNLNLFNWRPAGTTYVWLSLAVGLVSIVAMGYLALKTEHKIVRGLSLILCVCLAVLALTSLPAEPLGTGLLGRTLASPGWYRGLRSVVFSLPLAFWIGASAMKRAQTAVKS